MLGCLWQNLICWHSQVLRRKLSEEYILKLKQQLLDQHRFGNSGVKWTYGVKKQEQAKEIGKPFQLGIFNPVLQSRSHSCQSWWEGIKVLRSDVRMQVFSWLSVGESNDNVSIKHKTPGYTYIWRNLTKGEDKSFEIEGSEISESKLQ